MDFTVCVWHIWGVFIHTGVKCTILETNTNRQRCKKTDAWCMHVSTRSINNFLRATKPYQYKHFSLFYFPFFHVTNVRMYSTNTSTNTCIHLLILLCFYFSFVIMKLIFELKFANYNLMKWLSFNLRTCLM